jgi:glycine dehydrogenase
MLKTIGVESMDELIFNTIPDDILLENTLNLPEALNENEFASHIQKLGSKNKLYKT